MTVRLPAALALAALLVVPAQPAMAAKPKPKPRKAKVACSRQVPRSLTFDRGVRATTGVLRWKAAAVKRGTKAPAATYRVYRDGLVVAQTRRRSMKINVRIGRTYRLTIAVVTDHGKSTRCRVRLIAPDRSYRAPSTPQMVTVGATEGASTTITWAPSQPGDSPIAAYRVLREGAVYKQTSSTAVPVPLSSNRTARFTVTAIDRRGVMSAPSDAVSVTTGHTPPPVPTGLKVTEATDSAVALEWTASVPARGRLAGYRVLRDGKPLFQVSGPAARATNLFAGRAYTFSVQAIDTLGGASAASAPLAARTRDPDPTEGRLHAFLLATTDQSFRDFQDHYRQIGTLYPTYYDCTPGAVMTGQDDPLVTGWAQARRVEVMPRFNCQRTSVLNRIVNDPVLRAAWIDQICQKVADSGADGASIDFEAGLAADRGAYTSFANDLATRLHGQGQKLTIVASAKIADVPNHPRSTFFDYKGLSAVADHVFIMAWGIKWATSAPGAQDDIAWVTKVANYVKTMPDPSRFIMGTQLYAMDWASGGGAAHPADSYEYQDAVAKAASVGATPRLDVPTDAMTFSYTGTDGAPHAVWFSDATTVLHRMQVAGDRGIGFGVWRLGREDQSLWSNPLLAPVPSDPAP